MGALRSIVDRGGRSSVLALLACAAGAGCCDSDPPQPPTTTTPPTEPTGGTTGTTPTPAVGLRWPINLEAVPLDLIHNDCRLQPGCSISLHLGIDLAAEEDTDVFAIEAGVVVWKEPLTTQSTETNYDGVVVATEGSQDKGFAYLHLTDIAVDVGTTVQPGVRIGSVRKWDLDYCGIVDHMHLQAVRTVELGVDSAGLLRWTNRSNPSDGNTLTRMDLSVDVADPVIVDFAPDQPFLVCAPDGITIHEPTDETGLLKLSGGLVDVVAEVYDQLRPDGRRLTPYSVLVGVRKPGASDWEVGPQGFVFDEGIPAVAPEWRVIYRDSPFAASSPLASDPRLFYDVANDDGNGKIEPADRDAALKLPEEPGDYELVLLVEDAAGKKAERKVPLQIEAP